MATTGTQLVAIGSLADINSTHLVPDIQREVIDYAVDSAPIATLLSKMGLTRHVSQPDYEWQEILLEEPSVVVPAGYTGAGAGVTVNITIASLALRYGDTFYEPTLSQQWECIGNITYNTGAGTSNADFRGVPSTGVTVTRPANTLWLRLGVRMIDGGPYPEGITKTPVRFSNTIAQYAQTASVSNLADATTTYYGDIFEMNRRAALQQLRTDEERGIIFGKRFSESRSQTVMGATSTNTVRSSRGIYDSILTNRTTYTPPLTETTMDAFMLLMFGKMHHGSDLKIAFSGANPISDISSFAKAKFRYVNSFMARYGLSIAEYAGGFGNCRLLLVQEKQFCDSHNTGVAVNPHSKTMMVLDPSFIKLAYMGDAITMVRDSTPKNFSRYQISYESWVGTQVEMEHAHGLLQDF